MLGKVLEHIKTKLLKEGSELIQNMRRLKMLAKVGYERIEETEDSGKAFENLSFRNGFRCFFTGMIKKSQYNIWVSRFISKNMFEMTFVN